jgi:hypothetical protein
MRIYYVTDILLVTVTDFSFVPLYAYAGRLGRYDMKLQPRSGSSRYTNMALYFQFHGEEGKFHDSPLRTAVLTITDVKNYQQVLTGRKILKE